MVNDARVAAIPVACTLSQPDLKQRAERWRPEADLQFGTVPACRLICSAGVMAWMATWGTPQALRAGACRSQAWALIWTASQGLPSGGV
jgi:hypothetical protein